MFVEHPLALPGSATELEKAGSMCSVIHIFSSDSLPKQVGGIGDFCSSAVVRIFFNCCFFRLNPISKVKGETQN